jgi:hypothetical protein
VFRSLFRPPDLADLWHPNWPQGGGRNWSGAWGRGWCRLRLLQTLQARLESSCPIRQLLDLDFDLAQLPGQPFDACKQIAVLGGRQSRAHLACSDG